jgi:hypothetical protein
MQFEELPKNIQESMFSERIDEILDDIRQKAGIFDESLLPNIYYGLITKEIPAFDFVDSLANTGLGTKIASSVAKAIKERILESERYPLFKWGVDISDIKVSDAPDIETLNLEEFAKSPEKKITPEGLEENFPINIPIIKGTKEEIKIPSLLENLNQVSLKETKSNVSEENNQPFILEKQPLTETPKPSASKIFSTFSLNQIGFFKNKKTPEGANFSQPVSAQIETPKETKQKETKKVIHYSESQTPLAPWERGGEFLKPEPIVANDLSSTNKGVPRPKTQENKTSPSFPPPISPNPTPLQPKIQDKTINQEENQENISKTQPKEEQVSGPILEENVIDLRNINKEK